MTDAAEPLVSAQGRRFLIWCSVLSVPAVMLAALVQDTFNPLTGGAIAAVGVPLMAFATSPRRRFFTPLVWTIWYTLGCSLSFISLLLKETEYRLHASPIVGAFGFTSAEVWATLPYLVTGAAAIIAGTLLTEHFATIGRGEFRHMRFTSTSLSLRSILAWGAGGVILSALLSQFEIGRTGLVNRTQLPFHLGGILNYARLFLVPVFGLLILDLNLRASYRGLAKLTVAAFLAIALVGSLSALSRGYAGFLAMILLLYTAVNLGRLGLRPLTLLRTLPAPAAAVVAAIYWVNQLRAHGFSGDKIDIQTTASLLKSSEWTGLSDLLLPVFDMATARIGGLQELIGVLSAPDTHHLLNPWRVFIDDGVTALWLQRSVLGLVVYVDDFVATGFSFSLLGTLALSGSLLVLFAGVIAFMMFPIAIEGIFLRMAPPSVALTLAVYVGVQAWGYFNIALASKIAGMVAIIYMLMRPFLSAAARPAAAALLPRARSATIPAVEATHG